MNCEELKVSLGTPFPKIVEASDNPFVVALLSDLYAGAESELNATLTYAYQTHFLSAEIADVIEKIAIVEMRHLDELASAIKAFGGDPRYNSSRGAPFSTNAISYINTCRGALTQDLLSERKAALAYERAANAVKNESLQELLRRIKADEELHAAIIECLLTGCEG